MQTHFLFGKDYPDKEKPTILSVASNLALATIAGEGSTSRTEKKGSEDSAGNVNIPEKDITLLLLADGHDGYQFGYHAVQQFADILCDTGINSSLSEAEIKQKYLDAVLQLNENIAKTIRGQETTFASIMRIGNDYYSLATCDVYIARIRAENIEFAANGCFPLSLVSLKSRIQNNHPDYKRIEAEITGALKTKKMTIKSEEFQRLSEQLLAIEKNSKLDFYLPYVDKALPIRRWYASVGDIFLAATDAVDLKKQQYTKIVLDTLKSETDSATVLQNLIQRIMEFDNRKAFYDDCTFGMYRVE